MDSPGSDLGLLYSENGHLSIERMRAARDEWYGEPALDTKCGLREKLAALEHEQWAHWTRYMLDHLTPDNVEQWRRQIDTPYGELSEREKESDREWADRVLAIIGTV